MAQRRLMPSHPRTKFPGAVYHVSARGKNRQAIFLSDCDRLFFLSLLERAVAKYGLIIHAYCLMANHYHLLLETPRANLSAGMQLLNGSFARHMKKEHALAGAIFERPYHAVLIELESQFLETARYIVLNPVRANVIRNPSDFTWSSYRATAGVDNSPNWLSTIRILGNFSTAGALSRDSYIAYVEEGMKERAMNMFSSL
jgi:putative transposase